MTKRNNSVWMNLLYGVIGLAAGVLLGFLLWGLAKPVGAVPGPKVNICHATASEEHPYNALRVDDDGHWNGHDEHPGDFLYEGPVGENNRPTRDGNEWCEDNVPSRWVWGELQDKYGPCEGKCESNEGQKLHSQVRDCTQVFLGEEGYSEGPDQCKEGEDQTRERYEDCYIEEPVACELPEEPPVEEPRTLTEAGAPQCTDLSPILLPANFHVTRRGSEADLKWFQTQGDKVNIYFKEVSAAGWEHSVADVPAKVGEFPNNYNEFTVGMLNPALGYTFGLQQASGCAGGQLVTSVVVDGPLSVTFPFSYWTW